VQLLIAAGLAESVSPVEIVPHLYYPFLIGLASALAISESLCLPNPFA
jgi:hypothetical protein